MKRSAYTLLEMTLALAIALVILGAVYEFLNRQISTAEAGRTLVEESALARVILDSMATDIAGNLGGIDPLQLQGTSGSSSSNSGSGTTSAADAAIAAESFVPQFNLGVFGTDSVLILSTSRVPRELVASDKLKMDSSQLTPVSDIRRISYWYVPDEPNSGLARQEVNLATSTDLDTQPPDLPNAQSMIFAPEVKGLQFEYFDGTNWQSSWDGTQLGSDGQTPIGPPAAVRITLTLKSKDGQRTRDYKHVVALPAGNNFLAQRIGS
jgi:hypothetical protein